MIIVRETQFKALGAPRLHTYDLALEILEQAPFAEHRQVALGFAAVERLAANLAFEIDGDAVTIGGGLVGINVTAEMIGIIATTSVTGTAASYHFGVPQFSSIVLPRIPVGDTYRLDLSEVLPPAFTPWGNVGLPNITAGGHNDPLSATARSVYLLDHTAAIETADLRALSTQALRGFGTSAIAALDTAQVAALTTSQLTSLTTAQLRAIETADIAALTERLAAASRGEAFVLTGGDCAETFEGVTADNVRNKLRVLLQMSVVLTYAGSMPVVKLGRLAGQYAKPRSADTETRDGVTLPCYRGDIVNDIAFTEDARVPDPRRQLDCRRAYLVERHQPARQAHRHRLLAALLAQRELAEEHHSAGGNDAVVHEWHHVVRIVVADGEEHGGSFGAAALGSRA